jgi:hypothetical protein
MPEACAAEVLSSRLPQHSSMTQAPPSEGRGFFLPANRLLTSNSTPARRLHFEAPLLTAAGWLHCKRNGAPGNLMLREPRRREPYLRRALGLLAGCGSGGCTEPVMRMHGFTADELAELVRAGFAATATERTVGEWRQSQKVQDH